MDEQIVLEDDLLGEYFKFKNNEPCDSLVVSRLFSYYKPHLTNNEQLDRIGRGDRVLKQVLAAQGHISGTLEDLVKQTSLKLILSTSKSDYPYVNILKNEPIEANYTATFKNVSRDKAIKHIKALCKTATEIYIYDKFLENRGLFDKIFDLFPKTRFSLLCDNIGQSIISDWKKRNNLMTIKNQNFNMQYKSFHDRYLLIDRKIEVILTSGFDYLFRDEGDFTYIVRYLPKTA
jgi:hypothetical protein